MILSKLKTLQGMQQLQQLQQVFPIDDNVITQVLQSASPYIVDTRAGSVRLKSPSTSTNTIQLLGKTPSTERVSHHHLLLLLSFLNPPAPPPLGTCGLFHPLLLRIWENGMRGRAKETPGHKYTKIRLVLCFNGGTTFSNSLSLSLLLRRSGEG